MNNRRKDFPSEEMPAPGKHSPDLIPQADPEEPALPAEPDFIPEENPFETPPPFETASPGERP